MKIALVLGLASSLLACGPAHAAPKLPRVAGYEIGASWWTIDPDHGGRQLVHSISVGRWRRLTRALTWQTRLEYADLMDASLDTNIPEHASWSDLGRSLMLRTGIVVHPPLPVGIVPFAGASFGAGLVRAGDHHDARLRGDGWTTTLDRNHARPGLSIGLEGGLRLFTKPGWPEISACAGMNVAFGVEGMGLAPDPVFWIGY